LLTTNTDHWQPSSDHPIRSGQNVRRYRLTILDFGFAILDCGIIG
jgi:hypothetical protein